MRGNKNKYKSYITSYFTSFFQFYPLFDKQEDLSNDIQNLVLELIENHNINDLIEKLCKVLNPPLEEMQIEEDQKEEDEEEVDILNILLQEYLENIPSMNYSVLELRQMFEDEQLAYGLPNLTKENIHLSCFYFCIKQMQEGTKGLEKMINEICTHISVNRIMEQHFQGRKHHMTSTWLFYSKEYYPLWRKLFPDIELETIKTLLKFSIPPEKVVSNIGLEPYSHQEIVVIGDQEEQYYGEMKENGITLDSYSCFISVGFTYKSVIVTFPFIFPEEVEHAPKKDAQIGIKFYNTKGGVLEVDGKKYPVNCPATDIISLSHYTSDRKYLIKEVASSISTPYITGWVDFVLDSNIEKDISFTFTIDKPYPVTILKAYSKARIFSHYK